MILFLRSKHILQIAISFIAIWLALFFINLQYSRDVEEYAKLFHVSQAMSFINRLSQISWTRDPGYFFMQAIGSEFTSFPLFLLLIIFICLSLKLSATLRLFSNISLLLVLPYLLCLSFLHEGTQLRIAIALSVALWAMVLWAQNSCLAAVVILLAASLFHVSVAVYFIVFLVLYLTAKVSFHIYWMLGILLLLVVYFSWGESLITLYQGPLAQVRYMHYLSPKYLGGQNTSGLFYLYPIFIVAILGEIYWLYDPENKYLKKIKEMALVSGILALALLIVFSFAVQISTRLADLLLLLPLLVLGATLVQLRDHRRYFSLGLTIIALAGYCGLRTFISFGPVLSLPLL